MSKIITSVAKDKEKVKITLDKDGYYLWLCHNGTTFTGYPLTITLAKLILTSLKRYIKE